MNLFGLTQKFSSLIIRPPRVVYRMSQLGPEIFEIKNRIYNRVDFQVQNRRGFNIRCSLYKQRKNQPLRPIIIFLHANSSSQLTAYLKQILPMFEVVGFDFCGSGQSEGSYTTLGYQEKEDLYAVIQYLQLKFKVTSIVLWGRSMGAVTAILFTAKYHSYFSTSSTNPQAVNQTISNDQNCQLIKALILDSPFSSLHNLIKEFAERYFPIIPNFIVGSVTDEIQEYINQKVWQVDKTVFDIGKLNPLQNISRIPNNIPIFFLATKNDKLVNCQHTLDLYQCAKTTKYIEIVEGGHNDNRPDHVKKSIMQFIWSSLRIKQPDKFIYPNNNDNIDPSPKNDNKKQKTGLKKMFWKKDKNITLSNQNSTKTFELKENNEENPYSCSLSEVKVENMSSSFKNLKEMETQRTFKEVDQISKRQSISSNQYHERVSYAKSELIDVSKPLNEGKKQKSKCPAFLLNKIKNKGQTSQSSELNNMRTSLLTSSQHRDSKHGIQLTVMNQKKSIISMMELHDRERSIDQFYNLDQKNQNFFNKNHIHSESNFHIQHKNQQYKHAQVKYRNPISTRNYNFPSQQNKFNPLRWSHIPMTTTSHISNNSHHHQPSYTPHLSFKRLNQKVYYDQQPCSYNIQSSIPVGQIYNPKP